MPADPDREKPTLIGRSSSHFTRVARIFAAEMGVEHTFQIVRDLMSGDPADYGGNPALKIPSLRTPRGAWFGSLPVSRELWRQSSARPRVVWPEDLDEPLLANAQELTVQAMSTEVGLVLGKVSGVAADNVHQVKMRKSLVGSMAWLEEHIQPVLAALPADRALSYLEVTLFCLVTHLSFREVLSTDPYPRLLALCQQLGARPSAVETAYRFDA